MISGWTATRGISSALVGGEARRDVGDGVGECSNHPGVVLDIC